MKKTIIISTFLAFCLSGCESPKTASTAQSVISAKKPNVIFIVADDLGYGDLGSYGQTKIKTPVLDGLAQQGMRLTQHYAGATVCGPSRAALLTGMHSGHGLIRGNPTWTHSRKPVEFGEADVTVADVFKQAGYKTGVIGKWGMADGKEFNPAAMPGALGFDYFFGYKAHLDAHFYYWPTLYKNNDPFVLKDNVYELKKGQYTHDVFAEDALSFVKQNKDNPFFLYLAFTIPHMELTVPQDSKTPYESLGWPKRPMTKGHYFHDPEGYTAYAGMVSRMDRDIGKLMDTLKELGIDKDTLVIFTSDNGPEFHKAEEGKNFLESSGALRGGKRDLYEGGIRVPFIAHWPDKIKPNSVSDHISAFWDFMPTVCELTNIKQCPKNDGISYLSTLIKGKSQPQHDSLYWEFNESAGPMQALRKGDWKLIKLYGKPLELYNLVSDIGEKKNLAAQEPKRVESLLKELESVRTYSDEFRLEKLDPKGR